MKEQLAKYLIHLGDAPLILGHRLSEWCGHGPALEVDIALTNTSLDLLGQTRMYYQYAAELSEVYKNEDDIAFLRYGTQYTNPLILEQPNNDFAHTMVRQYLFDLYHQLLLTELIKSTDKGVSEIAEKSIKEVNYHIQFSRAWVLRLGDGTPTSHQKMQDALDHYWPYYKEMFISNEIEKEMASYSIGPELESLESSFLESALKTFEEATLAVHEIQRPNTGGKVGNHSEHLGYILAELQYMQRTYPSMQW